MRLDLFERYPELHPEGLVRVVNFAKLTRGYRELPSADQVTLVRSSCIDLIVCAFAYEALHLKCYLCNVD